eukprot:5877330-Lingulodinium_polyedra.AAC.1
MPIQIDSAASGSEVASSSASGSTRPSAVASVVAKRVRPERVVYAQDCFDCERCGAVHAAFQFCRG